MSNADNPKNGAFFQRQVLAWLQDNCDPDFESEKTLPIGTPAKDHKFDIVSTSGKIAIECKRYTWTETGNVPSAKMGFVNEAAFFLSFLPTEYEKYIVMLYSYHEKSKETLAEYYYRRYQHLWGDIKVAEYNPEKNQFHIIGDDALNRLTEPKNENKKSYKPVFNQDDIKKAVMLLQQRKAGIARYYDLLQRSSAVNVAEDLSFQKAFTAFYRLRRDKDWRAYYFDLFECMKSRKEDVSFGEIQLRLLQKCGQIESSFSSKMLATINPDMPIWDSYVLKNLGLKLRGKNKEERFSMAVVLYDNICSWYRDFLKTDESKEMIEMFNQTFPEYSNITEIKKIDFIIWALR